MNWWIGVLFAVGSVLFAVGSFLSLSPQWAQAFSVRSTAIGHLFFWGSLPFSTAACLQLIQAADAGKSNTRKWTMRQPLRLFGWRPHDVGWLSCAFQFPGTLLFNLNTLDAMGVEPSWLGQDLAIWTPDLLGSILFLLSGYLAFVETCHAVFAWLPGNLAWWVTFSNLLGCVGFMIAALSSFVSPQSDSPLSASGTMVFTLIGALGFLIGSLLMLAE